jgi:hypothetical protein
MEYIYTKGVGWHPRPYVEYRIVADYDGYKYRMEFRKPDMGEFFFYVRYHGRDDFDLLNRDGTPNIERCIRHAKTVRYKVNRLPVYNELYARDSCDHYMTLVPLDP